MLTNPAFNPPRSMRPFDFPYREPRHSACPPSPPSLFRFPGIRVIEFIAERMENMEEGFENVSRWGWNILPPFSSFLFVLYKRHVNFGLCIRIKQEYHFLFYKYTIQFKIRIFLLWNVYFGRLLFFISVLSSLLFQSTFSWIFPNIWISLLLVPEKKAGWRSFITNLEILGFCNNNFTIIRITCNIINSS